MQAAVVLLAGLIVLLLLFPAGVLHSSPRSVYRRSAIAFPAVDWPSPRSGSPSGRSSPAQRRLELSASRSDRTATGGLPRVASDRHDREPPPTSTEEPRYLR